MANHFRDIGFLINDQQDFLTLTERAARDGDAVKAPRGRYIRWSPGGGAELWIQVNAENELVGGNPHFAGPSRIAVALVTPQRDEQYPFDGGFYAWAEPTGDELESGAYPFVFDVPDFDALVDPHWTYPRRATAQIAAFAQELACYTDEASYEQSQASSDPRFGAESFIPSGLFGVEEGARPRAQAFFTGRIAQAERRTNLASGADFYWLNVHTFGGVYDVVADPSLLPEPPIVGGIAQGTFWLSGRILHSG